MKGMIFPLIFSYDRKILPNLKFFGAMIVLFREGSNMEVTTPDREATGRKSSGGGREISLIKLA